MRKIKQFISQFREKISTWFQCLRSKVESFFGRIRRAIKGATDADE